jgi:hypothetical protein
MAHDLKYKREWDGLKSPVIRLPALREGITQPTCPKHVVPHPKLSEAGAHDESLKRIFQACFVICYSSESLFIFLNFFFPLLSLIVGYNACTYPGGGT